MRLHRLPHGMKANRSLRRVIRASESQGDKRWRKHIPLSVKKRLNQQRARCGDGRRIGAVWDADLQQEVLRGIKATGNIRRVSRTLKVGPQTLYRRRKDDPHFAYQWEKNLEERYQRLEAAMLERLTDGWIEEVWGADGRVVRRRRFDHTNGVRLLQLHRKSQWEERRLAAEAEARKERIAACAAEPGELTGQSCVDHEGAPIPANHALFLDLMERHRNRHPDEWDEDIHTASGFDFNDWRAWVERWETNNADRIAEERAHYA